MSYLTDIETLRSYLRRGVKIEMPDRDPEDGTPILKDKIEFPVYAVVRNAFGVMRNIEEEAEKKTFKGDTPDKRDAAKAEWIAEQYKTFTGIANTMRIASGDSVSRMDSFYLVPLYPGMTEIRYLEYVRSKNPKTGDPVDRIIMNPNPLFVVPEGTFKGGAEFKLWADCPVTVFDNASFAAGESYNLECIIKFRQIDTTVSQLESIIKSLDIIKKNRIAMGNSITNSAFTLMGKKAYDEMKATFPPNVETIDMFYDEFKKLVATRKISPTTGKLSEFTVSSFNKYVRENPDSVRFIKTYVAFTRMKAYDMQVQTEKYLKRSIDELVTPHPFWKYFLQGVRGCGTLHAGYIIGLLDPTVCRHPSGFLRYLGLDVVTTEDGKSVGRNKKYGRELPYVDTNNDVRMNNSRGYNAKLKSRIWLLCGNMIKNHDTKYEQVYRDAVEYYKNRPDLKKRWEMKEAGELKGQDIAHTSPHLMAMRKMMSTFVIDLWIAMRRIKGLPLNEGSYAEGKLGIHHGYDHIPALIYEDGEPDCEVENGYMNGADW